MAARSQPATLEAALLKRLPRLLKDVQQGLGVHWPDYSTFLESNAESIAEASGVFVRYLLDIAGSDDASLTSASARVEKEPPPGGERLHVIFEQVGRAQMQTGNDLSRLLAAFQVGSRLAWRHMSETALELDLPPQALAALADAVFVFVNELSFSATRGYLQEQLEDARTREHHREELATLLLSDRADGHAVQRAAARAGWPIPSVAALVLVDPDDEEDRRVLDRLDASALPIHCRSLHGVIVSDPNGRNRQSWLIQQLRGAHAVIGATVAPSLLPRSAEIAQRALSLRRDGIIAGDPVLVADHLDTLIVWRDRRLIEALRDEVLAPLDELPAGVRSRLIATLTCWLRHQGDISTMAHELSVHPQTVRYRMAQLRIHFGDQLDSARSRARLFLVLQWPPD